MAYIDWHDDYSVKIELIDDQHKAMIRAMNDLYEVIIAGKNKQELTGSMGSLIEVTETHFKTEEELIISHSYPEHEVHKAAHDSLLEQIRELQESFIRGEMKLTVDVLDFLFDWLMHHIQEVDKSYMAYLNSRGVY